MATADVVPQNDNTTDVGSPTRYINKIYTQRLVFGDGTSLTTTPTPGISTETVQYVSVSPRSGGRTADGYLSLTLSENYSWKAVGGGKPLVSPTSPGTGTIYIDKGAGFVPYTGPIYLGSYPWADTWTWEVKLPDNTMGIYAQIGIPDYCGGTGGDVTGTFIPSFTSTMQSGNSGNTCAGVLMSGYIQEEVIASNGLQEQGDASFSMLTILNGSSSQSHGMTNEPVFCQCILQCTSTDGVFAVGDRVFVNPVLEDADWGFKVRWNSSNVYIEGTHSSAPNNGYMLIEHNTGNLFTVNIINAWKWNLIVNLFA